MNERTKKRLRALVPAAVFAAVVLALFGDILLSRTFILSSGGEDLTSYYVGMRQFGFSQLRHGNLPLWNPLLFSGAPYFGNFESALLYPLNWTYLFLPLAVAINFGIALHVFLAGWFTFLWRRYRGASEAGSILSGLLFMLSGPYFLHIFPGHLSNLCVMAWTPLLFLALDGWFETGEARWCLLGAFTVTMQILAGHPQYIYYTALAAALYSGLRLYGNPRAPRLGLGAAAMYAGAALLSAVQLLTGLQSVGEMTRGVGSQEYFAKTFSLAPENLLTLLMPGIFGDILRLPYYGRWHLWESCLFIGVAGLALAWHGAAEPGKRSRRAELIMVLSCVFLALGSYTPLYDVLYAYLPAYGMFRGTAKFIYLSALFLAALAGAGFDRLRGRPRRATGLMIGAGVLGALLTGVWVWLSVPADWGQLSIWKKVFEALGSTKETFFPPALYHSVAAARSAALFAAGQFLNAGRTLLLVSLLLYLIGYSRRWLYALALLAAFEAFSFAQQSRVVTRLNAEYPAAWSEAAANASGDFRVLHIGMPARNPVMDAGVQDVWGYSPLLMTRYFELTDYFWKLTTWGSKLDPKQMLIRNPLLALLRCRYVFLNNQAKDVLVLPPAPRLRLIDQWEVMKDPKKIFNRLMDPDFDARTTVVLEKSPEPFPEKGGGRGTAAVVRSSTDWLEIEADLPKPAILLVTDVYSEHWRARALPGSAQEHYDVLPADYALRAVPLSAGHHHLIMEYRPSGFVLGKWISLFSLAVFALLCVWILPRRSEPARALRAAFVSRRRLFGWLALILAAAVVEAAGFAAGAALGVWKTNGKRDLELGWILPYEGQAANKWYDDKIGGRAQEGLRRDDYPRPEILFLGDSVTRGGEIPDDRLSESFAEALKGFNAGMDGYSTYQERDLFVHDLASLRAKKIVLVVCFNDVMTEAENRDMIRLTLKENFDLADKTVLDSEPYYRIFRWLRARAAYRSWVDKDAEEKKAPLDRVYRLEREESRPVNPDVWREWTKCLLDIQKAARPGRFYLVLAPLRAHIGEYREGRRDFWVNEQLAAFSAAHGIPYLDLLPAFARAPETRFQSFGDAYHFTLRGHRIATAAIRDFLNSHER